LGLNIDVEYELGRWDCCEVVYWCENSLSAVCCRRLIKSGSAGSGMPGIGNGGLLDDCPGPVVLLVDCEVGDDADDLIDE